MPLIVKTVTPATAVAIGTLTSGSPVVTGLSDTSLLEGALRAFGTGVPRGALVTSIDSPTQLTLTTPATSSGSVSLTFSMEPIGLAEAKLNLKVDFDDDDSLIARKITAARKLCEVMAKRAFLNTVFTMTDDAFPWTGGTLNRQTRQFMGQFSGGLGMVFPGVLAVNAGILVVPRSPLVSVSSIAYLDTNGAAQVFDPSLYEVETGSSGRISPIFGQIWPVTYPEIGAITITFMAGEGATSDAIAETDKEAILLILGELYSNRTETAAVIPSAVMRLLGAQDNGGGYS